MIYDLRVSSVTLHAPLIQGLARPAWHLEEGRLGISKAAKHLLVSILEVVWTRAFLNYDLFAELYVFPTHEWLDELMRKTIESFFEDHGEEYFVLHLKIKP